MTGSNDRGMVIQDRDQHLLRETAVMRVIDREQAKVVGKFGSTTRVNTRLLKLTKAGLLRRFFLGTTAGGAKALYTLSEKGARFIGAAESGPKRRSDEAVVADFFILHQLAINEMYCAVKYAPGPEAAFFKSWRTFPKRRVPGVSLIPDGYLVLHTPREAIASFLEADLGHERLRVWHGKVRNYLDLAASGRFEPEFGEKRFRVLVVANSERRLQAIRSAVLDHTEKIFWFATFSSIRDQGFFAAIWRRPKTSEVQPFIRPMP